MTLLEELPHFTLWHDASCACLYATWSGSHSAYSTRVQYGLISKHLQATHSTKLLNDSLLDEDGWQEIIDWLADDCFHALVAEGLTAVAWVLPRHPGGLCDTAKVLTRLHQLGPLLVDTFSDAQAAYDWLQRWPIVAAGLVPMTLAAFSALPQAQQVALAEQHGHPLAPWQEVDCHVKVYLLGDALQVEIAYYNHSNLLHWVRACAVQQQ